MVCRGARLDGPLDGQGADGRVDEAAVVVLSEDLAERFDHLTELYERSMQVLLA